MTTLRIASCNVENLFSRAEVFAVAPVIGEADGILVMIDLLQGLLAKTAYSDADKAEMLRLYLGEPGAEGEAAPQGAQPALSAYIEVREERGKLWKRGRGGYAIVGVEASGAGDWGGSIEFKRARFSEKARGNTARVLKDTRADLLCVVEAEDLPTLREFDTHLMGSRYKYELLIDAFDPRGIDVGLYSKHPFGRVRTHMFEKVGNSRVFSRDCLEVEVLLTEGDPVHLLLNHFKSKGYDDGTADAKRTRQATRVKEILGGYDLTHDRVVVCGDFNDTPDSPALAPLLGVPDLHDVLELQFGADPTRRWTYHYRSFDQIDFVLVSSPLRDAFREAGVIRRGIAGLHALTSAPGSGVPDEKEYETVTAFSNQASDHAAVWAEFDL